jgi:hypothetical protein
MALPSYVDSIVALQRRSLLAPEETPPLKSSMPTPFDEELGLSFFRTRVQGDLSGLFLPRTFFSRSEISGSSFVGTDLSESFMCWNNFIDTDFSGASLHGADLRSSIFKRVNFTTADLSGANLQLATFDQCDFSGAVMNGAKIWRLQAPLLKLTRLQKRFVEWSLFRPKEPPGG